MEVYVARAFCKDGAGGNPAGVVLSQGLNREEKQAAAKKLGFSETVFLSPSDAADLRLEYFTPVEEVPLCGHATIGAFAVLRQCGYLTRTDYTIETAAGIFSVWIGDNGTIFMEQGLPEFFEELEVRDLCASVPDERVDPCRSTQIVSTGLRDILLPIRTPEQLLELQPDFSAITTVSKEKNVVGIHMFALTDKDAITAICRNFAPLYGISEEAATGTSNCALACYLFRHGIRKPRYVFEQGHCLNCVSQILVDIKESNGVITRVMVGGRGKLESKVCID